ncbi:hypothetical protein SAY87_011144 [Trapa incisa]|uniref:Uncharacterized protein n=1 Tax=Trapa incisa TaxID=236973 RepID=A0AAN7JIJ8_9MYRT|nr:hypothetical protein SAY87_011144 [Trapa incisa]
MIRSSVHGSLLTDGIHDFETFFFSVFTVERKVYDSLKTRSPRQETTTVSDFLEDLVDEEGGEEEEEGIDVVFIFFLLLPLLAHSLLSFASSISICSCLHSLLQNGVSPLHIDKKRISPNSGSYSRLIVKTYSLEVKLRRAEARERRVTVLLPVHEDIGVEPQVLIAEGARLEKVGLVVVISPTGVV